MGEEKRKETSQSYELSNLVSIPEATWFHCFPITADRGSPYSIQ